MNRATQSCMQNCHQQMSVSSVSALPKECTQQSALTDHITVPPSVSHQPGFGNEGSKKPDDLNTSKMQECVPLKKKEQYFVTINEDSPGYGFTAKNNVSTVDQMGSPEKLWPKRTLDNGIRPFTKQFEKNHLVTWTKPAQPHQQMYVSHKKNIAVVFPLPLEVVEHFKSLKNSTKVNEDLKMRPVAVGPYRQHALLQSRTRESDSESSSTSCTVVQTNHSSPETITQCMPAPIQAKDISHQGDSLYSVHLYSTNICMREESSKIGNLCSAGHIYKNVTTTNISNISGSESQSDTETAEQWSLQRLHRLMWDLEKKQAMSFKEVPFADLSSEILRLFWDGDFQKLCETAKSDHYVNIMKEVKLYHGKRNSVILQECQKLEELDLHNVKQNQVVPTVESESFQSLVLKSSDCNKKHGALSSLTMLPSTAKATYNEIRMEGDENVKGPEKYEAATSNEAASATAFLQAQSQPLLTLHENNCSVVEDRTKVLTDEPMDMDVERKGGYTNRGTVRPNNPMLECLTKPTLTVCLDNSKNVMVNSEMKDEVPEMEGKNKTAKTFLERSLNEQSHAMSDNCMHVNPEEDQPTTEMTSSLDECNSADSIDCCSFLEINVLSPETAKKLYFIEPNKEVNAIHEDVSVTCTEKNDQAIIHQSDYIPEDDQWTNINVKPAKNNIGNDCEQVKEYCCLAKWFQDVGYAISVPCACKKTTARAVTEETSSVPNDANTDELDIVEVITDYEDVRKIASAMSVHQMDEPLRTGGPHDFKKKEKCTQDSCKNKRTNHTSCGQLVAKSDLIANLSQDRSQGDLSLSLTPTGSDLQIEEKDKKTTTPEVQKKERMVNLALFGSFSQMHNKKVGVTMNNSKKKRIFGIRSFDTDTEHFPPATLNVRVISPVSLNVRRQDAKQRILKSWQNGIVPTQMFADKQSRKLKTGSKSRTETADVFGIEKSTFPTAFDAMKNLLSNQQHIRTHGSEIPSLAEQQKKSAGPSKKKKLSIKRNKMKKRILDSIIRGKRGQYAHKCKSSASSVELPCTLSQSKHESSSPVLDYRILPETFSFRDGSSLMEAHQSADTVYGKKTEAEKPKKRTLGNIGVWCVSPKKKGQLKSILPSSATVSANTFQAFKKKYEEKKIVHPKTT